MYNIGSEAFDRASSEHERLADGRRRLQTSSHSQTPCEQAIPAQEQGGSPAKTEVIAG
jgi:hypothetical protein